MNHNGTHTKSQVDGRVLPSHILQLASGELTQRELAEQIGVDAGTLSASIGKHFKTFIQSQAEEIERLKEKSNALSTLLNAAKSAANEAQRLTNEAKEETNAAQLETKKFQEAADEAQRETQRFQLERDAAQLELRKAQQLANELQGKLEYWQGQNKVLQFLASGHARTIMMFLLAAFEGVGSFEMLKSKGLLLALPVSVALAFALLMFTAARNFWGKVFCVVLALLIGGVFFDVFPGVFVGQHPPFGNWIFAFGVPSLGALLAFSKNK